MQELARKLFSCMTLHVNFKAIYRFRTFTIINIITIYSMIFVLLSSLLQFFFFQRNDKSDLLRNVSMVVPAFHNYGHKMACQVFDNLNIYSSLLYSKLQITSFVMFLVEI